MPSFAVDANVLVGLADRKDHRHADSERLVSALLARGFGPVYLDFLLAEAASVLCRRAEERGSGSASTVLETIAARIPASALTWASAEIPRLWTAAWSIMVDSGGALNFNDAVAVCLLREGVADAIATLDDDFNGIEGVTRYGPAES